MAQINDVEEAVKLKMQVLGVDEQTARFIDAIERGEINGDIAIVDDDGQEAS
jgi:hypothetical protein